MTAGRDRTKETYKREKRITQKTYNPDFTVFSLGFIYLRLNTVKLFSVAQLGYIAVTTSFVLYKIEL